MVDITAKPTTNPVPSQSPQDLFYNAMVFDALTNSSDETVPSRFGIPLETWRGITSRINQEAAQLFVDLGVSPIAPVDWVQGASVTDGFQLYYYSGGPEAVNGYYFKPGGGGTLPATPAGDDDFRAYLLVNPDEFEVKSSVSGNESLLPEVSERSLQLYTRNGWARRQRSIPPVASLSASDFKYNDDLGFFSASQGKVSARMQNAYADRASATGAYVESETGEPALMFDASSSDNLAIINAMHGAQSWCFHFRVMSNNASEAALFWDSVDATNRVALFMRSNDIALFWNGTYQVVCEGDYRDGLEHDFIVGFDVTEGRIIFAVDGAVTCNRILNATYFRVGNKNKFSVGATRFMGNPGVGSPRYLDGYVSKIDIYRECPRPTDIAPMMNGDGIAVQSSVRPVTSALPDPVPTSVSGLVDGREMIDVYILAGQSNSAGRGAITDAVSPAAGDEESAQIVAQEGQRIDNVYAYNAGQIEPLVLGGNNQFGGDANSNQFGPEIGLAMQVMESGRKAVFIRHAAGSTSLYSDWNPNSGSEGPEYQSLMTTISGGIAAIEAAGYAPRIAAYCWMQGERDAKGDLGPGVDGYYADYLQELAENVRAQTQSYISSTFPNEFYLRSTGGFATFVIARIKIGPDQQTTYPYTADLRTAQDEAAAAIYNAVIIETKGFEQNSDDLHFSAAGQIALGQAFYGARGGR